MATFNLRNPYDVEKFKERVAEMEQRGDCVELTRKSPQRSLSQNNYLHLIIGYWAQEFGYSLEQAKLQFFKLKCNRDIFVVEKINKHGEKIKYIRSSRTLDTQDMSLAITRFRNWSSAECNFYLPEANEKGMLLYAQQQVEKAVDYL